LRKGLHIPDEVPVEDAGKKKPKRMTGTRLDMRSEARR
jgi:hypothetical protein